jgi:hypothetical protein
MTKKKLLGYVAAIAALLAIATQVINAVPDSILPDDVAGAAGAAPVAADAGVK